MHNEVPSEFASVNDALDFAIQRELDSMLYYQEMKRFVDARQGSTVDLIIDEERKHFSILSKLRGDVAGS